MEKAIDTLEEKLGPLHGFVIPGETLASAVLHQARAIIRRAEREIVHLEKNRKRPDRVKTIYQSPLRLYFYVSTL